MEICFETDKGGTTMIEESYVSLGMIGYKDYGVNTKGEVISFRSNKKLRSKIDKGYETYMAACARQRE